MPVVAGLAKVSRPASCAPSISRERTRSANPVQLRNRSAAPVSLRHSRAMARPLADMLGPASPDPPPGLCHTILAFRRSAIAGPSGLSQPSPAVPKSLQSSFQSAALGSGTGDPPLDSAAGAGHSVLAMRQTDVVVQASSRLGHTVFEEHLFASRHAEAAAAALWWRQRCADVEAHAESVHGADRARAEHLVEQCKIECAHVILRSEISEHEQSARTQHIQTAGARAMAQTVAQARQHADTSFQEELRGIRTVEEQARQSLEAFETDAQQSVLRLQRNLEVVEGEYCYEEASHSELRQEAQGYRGTAVSALSQQRQEFARILLEQQQTLTERQEKADLYHSEIATLQLQQQEAEANFQTASEDLSQRVARAVQEEVARHRVELEL